MSGLPDIILLSENCTANELQNEMKYTWIKFLFFSKT